MIHGALDQPVALQITQGLDQHFFGDVGDLALQLVEPPHLAERDAVEDDRCPFVTDQVEDAPSRKAEVIGAGDWFAELRELAGERWPKLSEQAPNSFATWIGGATPAQALHMINAILPPRTAG